ncbi:alpha/beta fold hydrolase [Nocardioides sp. CPCC 205120]|uniref:alpha/beta fold hydrolase n=1 Tax=Nocardioides sp. CPCC 205120 TaxID=3406462 RepID=UPI003B508470
MIAERVTTFTNDGLTFDVVDSGPLDGDVVVLLHGFPQRSSCWDQVAPLLHAQGYRTVAPDQRGYSPGARPNGRKQYTLNKLVGDVLALLDALGEAGAKVHLVGHDWGSAIGWGVAAAHGDRIRTFTAVSVPHPGAFSKAGLRSPQLLRSWYIGMFQLPALPELLAAKRPRDLERILAHAGMRPEDLARFRREILEYGAFPGGVGYYRGLPFSGGGGFARRVKVPTTLVWSDGDTAVDRAGVEMSGEYVDAEYELVVLTGVSHWIPEHAPEALAEAVLERVGSAGGRP